MVVSPGAAMETLGACRLAAPGVRARRSVIRGLCHAARLGLLTLLLALTACAVKAPRGDGQWRPVEGMLPAEVDHFQLAGRLAVSDGRDGGSAGFLWTQRGDRFEVELRQPVSQRTWRLSGDSRGALLEGGDGGPRRGPSAEALLQEVLGWQVPVASLRAWVRGLASDDSPVLERATDDRGRLSRLVQDGWQVDYRDWLGDSDWPLRINASRPPYNVRLVIRDWAAEP